jgi:hypothetical protein
MKEICGSRPMWEPILGAGFGNGQRENRAAIRRGSGNPSLIGAETRVSDRIASNLIHIEPLRSGPRTKTLDFNLRRSGVCRSERTAVRSAR